MVATVAASAIPAPRATVASERPRLDGLFWTLEASAFSRTRRKLTSEELDAIGTTHSDFQDYKRDKAAQWLASTLPQSLVDFLVAGSAGVATACMQVPDPAERRRGLVAMFLFKAGPDGSALGKARRALEELVSFQPTDHLPASAILLNRLIVHVGAEARARARGS